MNQSKELELKLRSNPPPNSGLTRPMEARSGRPGVAKGAVKKGTKPRPRASFNVFRRLWRISMPAFKTCRPQVRPMLSANDQTLLARSLGELKSAPRGGEGPEG